MTSPRRILVVGSGGREHALAWRLARDPGAPDVWLAPGPAAARHAHRSIEGNGPDRLAEVCRREGIDLVVIGPEAPLAAGLADDLRARGVTVFGASAAAARLESSKWFAKEVMQEAGVPTARGELHRDAGAARAALERFHAPWVIKADGLAAGKGVLVSDDRRAAEAFLEACLSEQRFGESGRAVVVEEHLAGEELSVMAVCDGTRFVTLPPARDFKRAFDGDLGPNTGGMGAYAPVPGIDAMSEQEIARDVVRPILAAMAARGASFRGLLYAGLMLTQSGPRVLEFNVRFGDPETQAVLPLVGGDLGGTLAAAARGMLGETVLPRRDGASVAVALVDEGYPEGRPGAGLITGLDALDKLPNVAVFHAGTLASAEGWAVAGGRAAYVVAQGATLADARAGAYAAVGTLGGHGWRCRGDIAATAALATARN